MPYVITSDRKWVVIAEAHIIVTRNPETQHFPPPFDDMPPLPVPNVGAIATSIQGLEYRAVCGKVVSLANAELPKFFFALKKRAAPYAITLAVRLKDAPQVEIPLDFEFEAQMIEEASSK